MATSVLMASDDHDNTRVEMKLNGPEIGKRCGRKKSKPIDHGTLKKKKQPQRGMGVAQLERLRSQESWKKMTEINPNPNPNPLHPLSQQNHPFHDFGDPTPTRFGNFGAMNGSGLNQAPLYLQSRLGNGGFLGAMPTSGAGIVFPVDPYSVGASNPTSWASGNANMITDTSKELSSVPNTKCFSEHCGVCHKKKRLNGETLGCNGVLREVYPEIPRSYSCGNLMGLMNAGNLVINGQNQHVISTKLPIYQSYAGGGKIQLQEAEVRAVHRNGNSGGSGSNVVMEYDFFPGKSSSSSTCLEEWISLGSESSSSSSSVAVVGLGGAASCLTATTNISTAVFGASSTSAIDLSLKLSY